MFRAIIPPGVLPKKNLRNDVVLITGSGGGLGRQLALRFAQRGSKLILWDLNEKMNNETKKLVEAEGAEAHTMLVDLADRHAIVRSAKEAIKIYGRIDVLVNNAGIVNNKNFLDCSDEMMEKTIAVNCSALLYVSKLSRFYNPFLVNKGVGAWND
jgi:NAD(P)-dependent dehydrogenase (short-subunit alcohol dehydrogenase family)